MYLWIYIFLEILLLHSALWYESASCLPSLVNPLSINTVEPWIINSGENVGHGCHVIRTLYCGHTHFPLSLHKCSTVELYALDMKKVLFMCEYAYLQEVQ